MLNNFFTFIFYYFLILFSIYGYGLFFLIINSRNRDSQNFGYVGLIGLFFILIYSYVSNLFISHSTIHNLLFILTGLILFFLFFKKNFKRLKIEVIFSLIIFSILIFAAFISKNHDDFSYYHFPYTYYLTQDNLHFGVGQFNHGFRTPSSIFYLNSLFYLPFAEYYLFNLTPIFILGFANIILLKKTNNFFWSFNFNNSFTKSINNINYLSLLSFVFINIFFYRISEHGTDRSAQILVLIFIILTLEFLNSKKNEKLSLIYIYVLIGLIISLKAFYILYLVLFIPILYFIYEKNKNIFLSLKFFIINKYFIFLSALIFFILGTYFVNTGCIIYPVSFTCFQNLSWAIPISEVNSMNNWYELWSKAGANPNFRVDNQEIYIQKFNWVKHWIDNYFFNKVSDFFGGIILLSIIFTLFFIKPNLQKKKIIINKFSFITYLLILVLAFEWFYNHPALRYGGYCIFALIIFIPLSFYIDTFKLNKKKFSTSVFVLIFLTTVIFLGRNLNRINKEIQLYKYKPISETFYKLDENHFRIEKQMNELIINYNKCEFSNENCDLVKGRIKKKFGKIIFLNY